MKSYESVDSDLTVEPYQYEPEGSSSDSDESDDPDPEDHSRLANSNW